LEEAKELKL